MTQKGKKRPMMEWKELILNSVQSMNMYGIRGSPVNSMAFLLFPFDTSELKGIDGIQLDLNNSKEPIGS